MSPTLREMMAALQQSRRWANIAAVAISLIRALVLAFLSLALWAAVQPEQQLVQVSLLLGVSLLALGLGRPQTSPTISVDHVLFELELDHPNTRYTPFALKESAVEATLVEEWTPLCQAKIRAFRLFERRRLLALLATLPLPATLLALTVAMTPATLQRALANVARAVALLNRGATLTILEGEPSGAKPAAISLKAGSTAKIEVLAQNLIQLRVIGTSRAQGVRVELYKQIPGKLADRSQPAFQSLRLSADTTQGDDTATLVFAVTDDVDVYLPMLSEAKPLAAITVRQLAVPKVRLEPRRNLRDPWPDDQPIPLKIHVSSETPLQQVRLLINTGGKSATELVTNVLATDKHELTADYSLVLESYVQSDLAEVEVIAEALDRSLPAPRVGQSAPLLIRTASAFGRYRETLKTLRELKTKLDESRQQSNPSAPEGSKELMEQALAQSLDSPFFDSIDRMSISEMEQQLAELNDKNSREKLAELSEALNDFLFEHEALDDRERDRDFFVAARALSRLLEQSTESQRAAIPNTIRRLKSFLDDRTARWTVRVQNLGAEKEPKSWPAIANKPFHKVMDDIASGEARGGAANRAAGLEQLAQAVSRYREWISELEAAEDSQRQSQEAKRQQGLSEAREQIRDLQKRQGQISTSLDQATQQSAAKLKSEWPTTRMNQNTNVKAAGALDAQLRGLSPSAGERAKAAREAMEVVLESGNASDFNQAESASDLAGRLLRQADSATRKAQQRSPRGRRKRVSGDTYFGQQITGGDIEIKRDYEVSRRYREDLLDELGHYQGNDADEEDEQILENYLRRLIR